MQTLASLYPSLLAAAVRLPPHVSNASAMLLRSMASVEAFNKLIQSQRLWSRFTQILRRARFDLNCYTLAP